MAFAAQQIYTKVRFRCFVVKEKKNEQDLETKKGKKRKKKINRKGKKNLIVAKSGLVGMKGYLKTYTHVLPYLSLFE